MITVPNTEIKMVKGPRFEFPEEVEPALLSVTIPQGFEIHREDYILVRESRVQRESIKKETKPNGFTASVGYRNDRWVIDNGTNVMNHQTRIISGAQIADILESKEYVATFVHVGGDGRQGFKIEFRIVEQLPPLLKKAEGQLTRADMKNLIEHFRRISKISMRALWVNPISDDDSNLVGFVGNIVIGPALQPDKTFELPIGKNDEGQLTIKVGEIFRKFYYNR